YSSMYHRGCVWDVKIYPILPEAQTEEGDEGGALPPGALVSVSSDGTLRAWDMYSNICEESLLR
ncbi:mitogen-activated protein kinase binding protein 1, partial [Biomphalaria glabrata]